MLLNTPQCTGQSRDRELSSSNGHSAEVKTPWGRLRFLRSQKAQISSKLKDKLKFIKIFEYLFFKESVKKMKRHTKAWAKNIHNTYYTQLGKDLYPEYTKNS